MKRYRAITLLHGEFVCSERDRKTLPCIGRNDTVFIPLRYWHFIDKYYIMLNKEFISPVAISYFFNHTLYFSTRFINVFWSSLVARLDVKTISGT